MIPSRVPTADEVVALSQPQLRSAIKIGARLLTGTGEKWAIGGDAGEIMMGVNVKADRLEILTTKKGVKEICDELEEFVTLAPADAQKKLGREADIEGKMLPVFAKSYYAELVVDGVKVEIYGDMQLKVGEWEWGDPLDFNPEYTYTFAGRLPLVPLSLKSELALGLGWLDRVSLIADAVLQKHHSH